MRPMASRWTAGSLSLALFLLPLCAAKAAENERGKALFDQDCGTCHSLTAADASKRGPHLERLFSRRFGAVDGFPYRMVWKEADPVWTAAHLENYLKIHGRYDGPERTAVIEYLKKATAEN